MSKKLKNGDNNENLCLLLSALKQKPISTKEKIKIIEQRFSKNNNDTNSMNKE
jgi:hypothetical protein